MASYAKMLADQHRRDAAYHDRVADLAEADGDRLYAAYERGKAAAARQKAREMEALKQDG